MPTMIKSYKRLAIYIGYSVLCFTLDLLSYLVSLLFSDKRSALPVVDDHNLVTPASKLSQQIKSGHITSEEVVESFISRIKRINPIINAVVDKRFEQALKEAREIDIKLADARNGEGDKSILNLPLVGVPVSVKETIAVEGYAYTGGLLGRKFIKAPKHSDAVQQLIKNGLVPIALTNIPEMAMWWDCSNPVYGRTNNPYDLSRIPGGSSGGEAALLASAGSVIGIGSDIAGSIRIPANFCGVFGHKPTPFVVSTEGMYPTVKGEREKLLGLGPMCRYACDLLPLLKVMATTAKLPKLKLEEPVDLSKLKIFYVEDLGDPLAIGCNLDILKRIRDGVRYLVDKHKVTAEKVYFNDFKHGFLLWSAEANTEPDAPTMARQFKDGRAELNPFVELVKKIFQVSDHNINSILATFLDKLSPAYGSKGNRILTKKATELRKMFDDLVGDNGVLFVPSHPEPAPKHFTTLLKVFNVSYTSVTTVLQAPITQCPLGMSKEGLPIGVQILARPFNDKLTIAVAQELEKAFGGWSSPSRVTV